MIFWFLYNITMILSLTALAIHFEKWWIILFSVILFASYRTFDDKKKEDKNE